MGSAITETPRLAAHKFHQKVC